MPRCYFAHKIYRFLIPDAVVWLLLIPDGINGVFSNPCNVAKCTLCYKYTHLGLNTDKHNLVILVLTVNLTVNDIDHSF